MKENYPEAELMVTENGMGLIDPGEADTILNDDDSYENNSGYRYRFGLTYVDEQGNRTWKKSRFFFSEICKSHKVF